MTDPTPASAEPNPPASKIQITLKGELTSVSNWVGAVIGTVGEVLPAVTPTMLTGLGLSPHTVQVVSGVIALILLAYPENRRAAAAVSK